MISSFEMLFFSEFTQDLKAVTPTAQIETSLDNNSKQN